MTLAKLLFSRPMHLLVEEFILLQRMWTKWNAISLQNLHVPEILLKVHLLLILDIIVFLFAKICTSIVLTNGAGQILPCGFFFANPYGQRHRFVKTPACSFANFVGCPLGSANYHCRDKKLLCNLPTERPFCKTKLQRDRKPPVYWSSSDFSNSN